MARLSPPSRSAVRLAGLVVALLSVAVTAACGSSSASWQNPGGPSGGAPAVGGGGDASTVVTTNPPANAQNVSPVDPVTATVADGAFDTVTLTNPDGKPVSGDFDAAKKTWTSSAELGYSKKYTLTVAGNSAAGKHFQQSSTFSTLKPANLTLPYLRANVSTLLDKGTFGVGQPVVVWFDESIKDRATAEKTLSVTTDPPGIVGGWYWMDDHEVHWRPKDYWPAGTKVTVQAKVYGKNLGNGLYGQEDRSATFTIGESKIAIADSNTKHMKVYIGGKQLTTINGHDVTAGIPISMGKGGFEDTATGRVNFTTNSGPHVVTVKYDVYRMTSASFGITDTKSKNFYDVNIKKALRISADGEFVHDADWNVPAHGKVNTSHGCINVGPNYIFWFYDTFGAGDIVDVTNTTKKLDVRNGLGDWVLSWDQWQKGSALS